jgi:tripartite-type tricarboxylate transporter receptor subunit TctC
MRSGLIASARFLAIACVAFIGWAPAHAADFYEGKTIRLIIGSGAGSAYDLYGRLLAAYLGNHIPGKPTIVPQQMLGAAGLVSANYMAGAAPRDGTVIAGAVSNLATSPLLRPDLAKFDARKFNWLGNMAQDIFVAFVWNTVPVRNFEDLKTRETIMGAINQAMSSDMARLANAFAGTKIKLVTGYEDQTGIKLGIERGELEGTFGSALSGLKLEQPDWIAKGTIRMLAQIAVQPSREFPDVPLFIDQVKGADEHRALELALAPLGFTKPFYAPPEIPADRAEILRRAFEATMKDPEFLAAAARARISLDGWFTGEVMAQKVAHVAETPKNVVEKLEAVLSAPAGK